MDSKPAKQISAPQTEHRPSRIAIQNRRRRAARKAARKADETHQDGIPTPTTDLVGPPSKVKGVAANNYKDHMVSESNTGGFKYDSEPFNSALYAAEDGVSTASSLYISGSPNDNVEPPGPSSIAEPAAFISSNSESNSSAASNTLQDENIDQVIEERGSEPASPATSASDTIITQKVDNYYTMSRPERQFLLLGPQFTMTIGSLSIPHISKRTAMALSPMLNTYFLQSPNATTYHFPSNHVDPDSIRHLLITYPHLMADEFMTYSIPPRDTFLQNVTLLRASRILGMDRYTKMILTSYIAYVRHNLPSYEEIAAIDAHRTSDKDPLWTRMVNHLCWERYRGGVPDPEAFEAFLEGHGELRDALGRADVFFSTRAEERRRGRGRGRVGKGKGKGERELGGVEEV